MMNLIIGHQKESQSSKNDHIVELICPLPYSHLSFFIFFKKIIIDSNKLYFERFDFLYNLKLIYK